MEIKSSVRQLSYVTKLLLGDTEHILPYPAEPQKPAPQQKQGVPLPRCTPKDADVRYDALDTFYRALAASEDTGAHCAIVVRHGKVVSEGFFAPYAPAYWQVTHSLAKSFVCTAIGMLADEGMLSPTERVIDILPEKVSLLAGRRTRAITVDDLLTMRSGANFREIGCVVEKDWTGAFFSSEMLFEPGTKFDYNSMNTYLLSAILTRKTGKTVYEYLRPRLFEPLGFGSVAWENCPLGNAKGGWGLYVRPEDVAKLGLLYLQRGVWTANGAPQRLLSEEWIDFATDTVTQQTNGENYARHIWTRGTDGTFLFNGMFGQYMIAVPKLDAIIVITSGANHLFINSPAFRAAEALLEDMRDTERRERRGGAQRLAFTLSHLQFEQLVPDYRDNHPIVRWAHALQARAADKQLAAQCAALDGQRWCFPANRLSGLPLILGVMNNYYSAGVQEVGFTFTEDVLTLHWHEQDEQQIPIGFGEARMCELSFGGNRFVAGTRGVFARDEDNHTVLKLTINFVESTSTLRLKLFFMPSGLHIAQTESPSVMHAMHLIESTMHEGSSKRPNVGILKDQEYLAYRLNMVLEPRAVGTPIKEEADAAQ